MVNRHGCGYGVQIGANDLKSALECLTQRMAEPVQIYVTGQEGAL